MKPDYLLEEQRVDSGGCQPPLAAQHTGLDHHHPSFTFTSHMRHLTLADKQGQLPSHPLIDLTSTDSTKGVRQPWAASLARGAALPPNSTQRQLRFADEDVTRASPLPAPETGRGAGGKAVLQRRGGSVMTAAPDHPQAAAVPPRNTYQRPLVAAFNQGVGRSWQEAQVCVVMVVVVVVVVGSAVVLDAAHHVCRTCRPHRNNGI
jgi:hypothetical protein